MKTIDYMNMVRKLTHTGTNYAVAKILGISNPSVYKYTNENGSMSEEVALKVAEILQLDPALVLADVRAEQAQSHKARRTWEKIAARLKNCAASVAIGALLASPIIDSSRGLYIMLSRRSAH